MRAANLLLLLMSCAWAATAAEPPVPPSPYDTNPKCTERSTDSNSPECVLEREGEPRHTYPPPPKRPPQEPPQKPTPPQPKQRPIQPPASGGMLR